MQQPTMPSRFFPTAQKPDARKKREGTSAVAFRYMLLKLDRPIKLENWNKLIKFAIKKTR